MNTVQYIAAVKAKLGISSDYALAARLGITRSYMSMLSNGKQSMSNDLARAFANILKIHPGIVMLDAEKERAKDAETRRIWEDIQEGFHAPLLRAKSGRRHHLAR
jgi:transcriptional regulator with XRE-family HTH domain